MEPQTTSISDSPTTEEQLTRSLPDISDQTGEPLSHLCANERVLLVFLRHEGCPFSFRQLTELAEWTDGEISGPVADHADSESPSDLLPVVVHMWRKEKETFPVFARYGLAHVRRISDPDRVLYRHFGMKEGSFMDIAGPHLWWAGFKAVACTSAKPRKPGKHIRQLAGAVLIENGRVLKIVHSRNSADLPDLHRLVAIN